jgi:hypothetical protein
MTRAIVWAAGAIGAAVLAVAVFATGNTHGVERLVWDGEHGTFVYTDPPGGDTILIASIVLVAALVTTSLVCAWASVVRAFDARRGRRA